MCSSALANFFIEKAKSEGISLTNMKLQKLMFIGYGWVLALTEKDLTDNEGFGAWQHGPVLPSVYHQLKTYGGEPIQGYVLEYNEDDNEVIIPKISSQNSLFILNKVWGIYKDFSASALRNLTHQSDTPWQKAWAGSNGKGANICPNEVSSYYFKYIMELLKDEYSKSTAAA